MLRNNDSACFSSWELAQQVVAMVTGDSAGRQFYFWHCRITGNTQPRRKRNHLKNFFIQCSGPGPDNPPVPGIHTWEFPCTDDELVKLYFRIGFSDEYIIFLLAYKHSVAVGVRTLKRLCRKLCLFRRKNLFLKISILFLKCIMKKKTV